jgi:signal transduction histidine kinase
MTAAVPPATLLLVDDDRGLLRLIQKALQRAGLGVVTAVSGNEAIAWLTRNCTDLMLLDLKLQDIEGKELVNHLASINRSVPFIVITGQGDQRVAVDMMKHGALDYLVKDADFLAFLPAVVTRALEQVSKDRRLIQLQKQVLEISEREQRRIGQDLHDGLGQQLTAIELMCQALKSDRAAVSDTHRVEKELDSLSRHIRAAIAQTRSLAHGLTPFKVESGGLELALTELAQTTTTPGRLSCSFHCPDPVSFDGSETALHLYRIAQEAVTNAIRHSGADKIKLELSLENGTLRLRIADNGKGFPPTTPRGLGLDIMSHRAAVIGAVIEVKSTVGKGVTVTCALPVHN